MQNSWWNLFVNSPHIFFFKSSNFGSRELDLALEIWKFINRLSIEVLRSVGEFRQLCNTKLGTSGVSKHLTHLGRVFVDAALCTSLQKLWQRSRYGIPAAWPVWFHRAYFQVLGMLKSDVHLNGIYRDSNSKFTWKDGRTELPVIYVTSCKWLSRQLPL